jgi:hypothetical protein
MKKKIILLSLMIMCIVITIEAQKMMSAPSIMIVPDELYCNANGYVKTFKNQGITETRPDYERALTEDRDLNPVLTQVGELVKERDDKIEIKDIVSVLNNYRSDMAMNANNNGDDSESADEAIIRSSLADVLIKIEYTIRKNGPQHYVQYTIKATDSYNNNSIGQISGIGEQSTSAAAPILVREAIFQKMDEFLNQILRYYTNMQTSGRAIAINFKIKSGSSINMNSVIGDTSLGNIIDDYLNDNSVEGNGVEKVRQGTTFRTYEGVYFPMFVTVRGRQRKLSAGLVSDQIKNMLETKYQLKCEFKTIGLGKVNFYISK